MTPKVSILIPCYNADRWIAQAIDSALNQTYPNTEVIVVDDGSSDRSLEIIKSYSDRVRWETGANQGGNIARNRLLELSTGDWLQYLDADDYLLPEKVERQMDCLANAPQADVICSPAIAEYHRAGQVWQEPSARLVPRDPWILLARWYLPQTGGSLWRKQALLDVGGWKVDQPCCQEHELYSRLLIAGKQFAYLDESAAVYRLWSSSTVSQKDRWEPYRRRLEIKDRIERHLAMIEELTEIRQAAIHQSRFDCARTIYNFDQTWATQIISELRTQVPSFVPSGITAPPLYQFFYRKFGFNTAESIAKAKRLFTAAK
jgi:glycosyltransferase involved in cell wall biosynthesis